jgi:hypothetical protein
MQHAMDLPADHGKTAFHAGENIPVQNYDAHQAGQIIDGPEPGHVGLGSADAAAKGKVRIKSRVGDGDGGMQPIPAEIVATIVFDDRDLALLQFLKMGEYGTPRIPGVE